MLRGVGATPDQRREFGEALAVSLDNRTAAWLGAEIARAVGKRSPITQSAVSQWVRGETEPERDYVFAAERILDLRPGTLSRLLGYLPVDAKSAKTVPDAIDSDPALTDRAKAMLRAVYREAIRQ